MTSPATPSPSITPAAPSAAKPAKSPKSPGQTSKSARRRPRFGQWLYDIWQGYITSLKGFHITAKEMFKKPVTLQYPEQSTNVPPQFRGLHEYDLLKCNACGLCTKVCPVDAIDLKSVGKGKNARVTRYAIDYTKCLFCNLCAEACPSHAIWMGDRWNHTSSTRLGCWVEFRTEYPETPVETWEDEETAASLPASVHAKPPRRPSAPATAGGSASHAPLTPSAVSSPAPAAVSSPAPAAASAPEAPAPPAAKVAGGDAPACAASAAPATPAAQPAPDAPAPQNIPSETQDSKMKSGDSANSGDVGL